MLSFDDIVFRPHPSDGRGLHGTLDLPNGIHFSVTRGRKHGFVTEDEPYEVFVEGEIYENMTSSKITALLAELQSNPPKSAVP